MASRTPPAATTSNYSLQRRLYACLRTELLLTSSPSAEAGRAVPLPAAYGRAALRRAARPAPATTVVGGDRSGLLWWRGATLCGAAVQAGGGRLAGLGLRSGAAEARLLRKRRRQGALPGGSPRAPGRVRGCCRGLSSDVAAGVPDARRGRRDAGVARKAAVLHRADARGRRRQRGAPSAGPPGPPSRPRSGPRRSGAGSGRRSAAAAAATGFGTGGCRTVVVPSASAKRPRGRR